MAKNKIKPFPVLKTERLTLRQLEESDSTAVFALRSDPEVNKYLGRQPAGSVDDAKEFINKMIETLQTAELFYWAINVTDLEQLAGTISLFDISALDRTAELGFELLPHFQGHGFMQEAILKVVEFAFGTLGLKEISACTHDQNKSAAKVLRKCRFIASGRCTDGLMLYYVTNSVTA